MTRLGQEGFGQFPVLKPGQSINGTGTQTTGLYTQNKVAGVSGAAPQILIPIANPSTQSTIIVRGSFIAPNSAGNNATMVTLAADGAAIKHIGFGLNLLNQIQIIRGTSSTILGTSTDALVLDGTTRHHFEFKATIADAGGSIEVRIDGAVFINLTGIDTRNGGTNTWPDGLFLNGANSTKWADIMWQDTLGSSPYNDFMGDQLVLTQLPNGDGASSQWLGSDGNSVNNSLLVDENPLNTTDYVGDNVAGHRDLYAFEDLPVAGTVHAVQVHAYAIKTDAGARSVKLIERMGSGANPIQASTARPLGTTTYSMISGELLTTDADGTAWDVTKFNAAQFGVELV